MFELNREINLFDIENLIINWIFLNKFIYIKIKQLHLYAVNVIFEQNNELVSFKRKTKFILKFTHF